MGFALVADGLALFAMASRIADFGMRANKVAAMGMNIVLLLNLAGLTVFLFAHVAMGGAHRPVLRFQASFLWVITAYLAVIAFAFPPLFSFV